MDLRILIPIISFQLIIQKLANLQKKSLGNHIESTPNTQATLQKYDSFLYCMFCLHSYSNSSKFSFFPLCLIKKKNKQDFDRKQNVLCFGPILHEYCQDLALKLSLDRIYRLHTANRRNI